MQNPHPNQHKGSFIHKEDLKTYIFETLFTYHLKDRVDEGNQALPVVPLNCEDVKEGWQVIQYNPIPYPVS